MRVDVWSDLTCPWCGIGSHRLDEALAKFEHADEVDIVHHPFELDDSIPVGETQPVLEYLQARFTVDEDRAAEMCLAAESMASEAGIRPYHVGDNVQGNTRMAHQLMLYAVENGLEREAWRAAYDWYFGRRKSLFDVESLVELAVEIGLDPMGARVAMIDPRYSEIVVEDKKQALELGLRGVPFFIIGEHYAISGAQPTEHLLQGLEQAWAEGPSAERAESAAPMKHDEADEEEE